MIPTFLERYPAIANPLPVAWDGQGVSWDEWADIATFICVRHLKKPRPACSRCRTSPRVSLVIHGHVGTEDLPLTLLRCPNCGADTVVDWNNNAWDLDESDYGPDGSWDYKPPPLFDPPPTQPKCSTCGREGNTAMTTDANGAHHCTNDELCARRARAHRKDS